MPPPPLPSSTVVASTVVSSGENGDEEELDMEEVMSGVFHQKKNSGSGGSPAPSPKPTASSTRLGGTGEVVLDETVGRRSSNVVLSAAAAGGGVNLEALQTIVQQPGVVETDADRIKREEAERASKVAQSGAAPGNKDGKSPPLAASTTVQGAGNKQTPPPESRRVKKGCSCRIC